MSEPSGPGRDTRRRPGRWWVLSGVLLLIATGSFVVALHSHRDPLAGPVASPSVPVAAPPSAAAAQPGVASPAVARSAPVALRIPAIGVAVAVSALGLNPDGTVQVPANFQEPGWYRLGPSPGQVGSAVILGHVDSYQGPAVFFRLRSLRPGDRVEVILADGVTVHFVVDVVAMYPKNQFPARLVYGSRGYAALQLVTCGGAFDTSTRSYLSNVVVYTSLVATTSAAAGPAQASGVLKSRGGATR